MDTRRRIHILSLHCWRPGGCLVLSVCFLLGSLLGTLLSAHLSSSAAETVSRYLADWSAASVGSGEEQTHFLPELLHHLRFLLLCAAMGAAPIGVVGIPLLFGVRGLLLSFTAASFLRLYGLRGLAAAAVLYGPAEAVGTMALFALGVLCFSSALEHAAGGSPPRRKTPQRAPQLGTLLLGICTALTSLGQTALSPWLVKTVCWLLG